MEQFRISPVEQSRMSPVKDSKDVEKVEKVEKKEQPDEFGKLLARLKEKICKLENDEAKSEITESLELLKKVNDEELKKDSLATAMIIIDNVKNLIEKYEAQNDPDKKTKRISLMRIKDIEDHCEKYIGQV